MNRQRPLVAAGLVLGAALGGFFDGIVFHQLLQWHNLLSTRIPPMDLQSAKINMFWDGAFHAALWLASLSGIAMLFRAGRMGHAPDSGQVLLGSGLAGWGVFNLVEGTLNHHLLGLHHVLDNGSDPLQADLLFLAFGVVLLGCGWWLVRRVRPAATHNTSW